MTERIWIFLAGVLLIAAAALLWRDNFSAAFVTAALGGCAWFLSYRSALRAKDSFASDDFASSHHEDESTP